jgi:hypothetical protein
VNWMATTEDDRIFVSDLTHDITTYQLLR